MNLPFLKTMFQSKVKKNVIYRDQVISNRHFPPHRWLFANGLKKFESNDPLHLKNYYDNYGEEALGNCNIIVRIDIN